MSKLLVLLLIATFSLAPVFAETSNNQESDSVEAPTEAAVKEEIVEPGDEDLEDGETASSETQKPPVLKQENKTQSSENKLNNKKNKIKFSLKDPKNLLFKDETVEIYMKKFGMSRDWLTPYYSMQKVLVVNLTDRELTLSGDIYNKVYKEEAKQKVFQVVEAKRQKSNAASGLGAVGGGLLGAAVILGSVAADVSIANGQSNLLGQISKLVDDKLFSLKIAPNAEETFSFLIERKNSPVPAVALAYSVEGRSPQYFVQGYDKDFAIQLLSNPSLYEVAYVDKQLLQSKKTGIYLTNSEPIKKAKNKTNKKASVESGDESASTEPEDKAYEIATYIEPINLNPLVEEIKPQESENNNSQTSESNGKVKTEKKATKPKTQSIKLPEAVSKNVFQQKYLRIFAYQNVKAEPRKVNLQIIKLSSDAKKGLRQQTQATSAFSFKEVKPGVVEITPIAALSPGEYVVKNKESNIVYDFSITKPAKASSRKK